MCTKLFHLQILIIIFLHVPTIFHRFPTPENTPPGTRPIPPLPPSCAQMRPAAPRAPRRRHRRQRLRPKPRRRRRPGGRRRRALDAWGRGKRTEIFRWFWWDLKTSVFFFRNSQSQNGYSNLILKGTDMGFRWIWVIQESSRIKRIIYQSKLDSKPIICGKDTGKPHHAINGLSRAS